jgi:hypothetical protein
MPRARTNVHKSRVFQINCPEAEVSPVLGQFNATIAVFPCQYLGLPLRTGRIQREDEQILIDKVAAKLPRWKGRLLNTAGRLTLINSVLSSVVIHHMTMFQLSKWAIRKIDKICRAFLWWGTATATGGHCMVNWKRVLMPKWLGGLGIADLSKFKKALRLDGSGKHGKQRASHGPA